MKLILIHGRAQETRDEVELKKEWLAALHTGLKKSNLVLPENVSIEFPYYGKLLKKLVDDAKSAPVEGEAKRSGTQIKIDEAAEIDFYEDFLGEIATHTEMTPAERAELLDIQNTKRGPLNWAIVQKLLVFLDKKKRLGDPILKSFTRDVFLYLTISGIKKQINEQVLKSFDTEPCVVVGHSLGSIISYLLLKNNPQLQVKKFITVGSPLGLNSVRKYLEQPLRMPECINPKEKGWYNAFDERDFVALNPLDREYFNIQPPIENKNDVNNRTSNRHGIEGYLEDAVVAQKIYEALR